MLKMEGGTAGRVTEVKTKTLNNAGAAPHWTDEVHDFQLGEGAQELRHGSFSKGDTSALRNLSAGRNLNVAVYDADGPHDRELIGSCNLGIDQVLLRPNQVIDDWYHVAGKKSGKSHGQIHLQVVWMPLLPQQSGAVSATLHPSAAVAPALGQPPAFAAPRTASSGSLQPPPQQQMQMPQQMPQPQPQQMAALPQTTSAPPAQAPPQPHPPPPAEDVRGWYFVDPAGATQGPFTRAEMQGWQAHFAPTVQVAVRARPSCRPYHSITASCDACCAHICKCGTASRKPPDVDTEAKQRLRFACARACGRGLL